MTDFLDIPALRAAAAAEFKAQAAAHFAENPNDQSIVYAVAQYFADEAPDAVHELGVTYPSRDPWWPHRCAWEAPPADGSRCRSCSGRGGFGALESNDEGVYAHAAFCAEGGGGEGESELHEPIWIARREADGQVSLEWVGHLARPWLDFPNAFADREDAYEPPPPGLPDPAPIPWTPEEAAMVARIYADPDDDATRRVLVDHWLEQGDPRGDFGSVSFDGKHRTADRAWLGPLTAFVGYAGVEFGRGPFAQHVVARFSTDDPPAHPEWATVASLRFATGGIQRFVPTMTGLRAVHGVNASGLRKLAEAGLTRIHTLGVRLDEDPQATLAAALAGCSALKHLTTLILEDAPEGVALAPLVAPFAAQLKTVEVWLTGDQGWDGGGASKALGQLVALPSGLDVAVGHQAASGSKRGLVASARSGERTVHLDHRGLPNPSDLAAAQTQLKRFALGPLSPRVTAVPAGPPRTIAPAPVPAPIAPIPLLARPIVQLKEAVVGTSITGWAVIGATLVALLTLLILRLVLL